MCWCGSFVSLFVCKFYKFWNCNILIITKLDKEKNQFIRQKSGAQNIVKEIKQYQGKWLQHIQRMDTDRLPKQALKYKPKVATTCTEDGHRQATKTSTTI